MENIQASNTVMAFRLSEKYQTSTLLYCLGVDTKDILTTTNISTTIGRSTTRYSKFDDFLK